MEEFTFDIMKDIERTHWWYLVRRKIVQDLTVKHIVKGDQILEVGCGTGETLSMLAAQGHSVEGTEINDGARDYAQKKGLSVTDARAETLPFSESAFDLVFLLDVIEHVEDHEAVIAEIARVLKPGGTLIVFAPAYMFLWGRQDEISQHYRRYTKQSLSAVVKTKLQIVRASYFNFLLFLPIASVRILVRVLRLERLMPHENRMTNGFVNKILFLVFNCERWLLPWCNLPFGVSVMVVAKKHQ